MTSSLEYNLCYPGILAFEPINRDMRMWHGDKVVRCPMEYLDPFSSHFIGQVLKLFLSFTIS